MPPYTPVEWVGQEERSFAGGKTRLVVTFQVLDGQLQRLVNAATLAKGMQTALLVVDTLCNTARYDALDLLFVQLHTLCGKAPLLFVHLNHQAEKKGAGSKLWILPCSLVQLLLEAADRF